MVKKIQLIVFLFLLVPVSFTGFSVLARPAPVNPATSTTSSVSVQPLQSPLSELPQTQRSKLKIIQYTLLPLAVGVSTWFLMCLEKTEENKADT